MDFISQTKGAISETEMSLFMGWSPGLRNSKRGNMMMLDFLGRMAQRKRDISNLVIKYTKQNGGVLDPGFDRVLSEYRENTLFFTDEDKSQG